MPNVNGGKNDLKERFYYVRHTNLFKNRMRRNKRNQLQQRTLETHCKRRWNPKMRWLNVEDVIRGNIQGILLVQPRNRKKWSDEN